MQDFQHIIITRFNLRNKDWDNQTKNKTLTLTNEWLTDRFGLFETYCFPSVINQINQNFEWWVFFDEQTPDLFVNRIKDLTQKSKLFKPIFIDGMDEFLPTIQKKASEIKTPFLISSRLDNDDCLHKEYVEYIQQQFSNQKYLALDIVEGYTLQIQPKVRLGYKKHLYNPFITLIEENNQAQTVWGKNKHGDWKKEKNLKRIENKQLWMSVIHNNNKVNEFTGFGKVNLTETLEMFGIPEEKIKKLNSALTYSKWLSLKNNLKTKFEVGFKDFKKKLGRYN